MDTDSLLGRFDRLFPREVMGGLLVALAAENIISALFTATIPPKYAILAWTVILAISGLFVQHWTAEDTEGNF